MKRVRAGKIFLVPICCALAVAACTSQNAPAPLAGSRSVVSVAGRGSLKIVPENPTSGDNLEALIRGAKSVTFQWLRNGETIEGARAATLVRKLFKRGDVVTLRALIEGRPETASVTIRNSPPAIESISFSPEFICRGVDIMAKAAAFDHDGDDVRLVFKWMVNGQELLENSPVLKGDRFRAGDRVSLKVTPSDGHDEGKPFFSQAIVIPHASPTFVSTPPTDFQGRVYRYSAKAVDPDGGTLTYSLISAPSGMTIDSALGSVVWPVRDDDPIDQVVEIRVENSSGGSAAQKFALRVSLPYEGK